MSNTPQAFAQVVNNPEAAQQQQQPQQNPLSCEVCRRRKTKCDRKLPSCTHCIDAKATCHYPEAKQRGPQVGYLAVLESRLVNTEAVLYDALSKLYQHQSSGGEHVSDEPVDRIVKRLQERYSNMPYSAKTSEWHHQPLLAEEDRQRWWLAHQQILNDGESPHAGHGDRKRRALSHSSSRTVDTGEPGFITESHSRAPYSPADIRSSERPLSSNPSPGVNVPATVDPEIAAELDEEQLQKYF